MTITIDDLADECADRRENGRGWLIARNWIARARAAELLISEPRTPLHIAADGARGDRALPEGVECLRPSNAPSPRCST